MGKGISEWDVSKVYTEGDKVYFQGQLYKLRMAMLNGKYILAFVPVSEVKKLKAMFIDACNSLTNEGIAIPNEWEDIVKEGEYRDGEPCDHPGCLSHISHPCEGCGRIGGVTLKEKING